MRLFLSYLLVYPLFSLGISTDNFADGDFTNTPPWSGDVLEYKINISNQLQLNNTVAGGSYLSTDNLLGSLDNIEWQFYIKQSFSPSSSNYGRIYLVSDQSNLETSLNGYYLQFGESGSNDAVELFKQTGSTSVSVARGTNGEIANSFSIRVKVTRNNAGLWSLYIDPTGGNNFALEANGTDNTYTTSAFFGISCVYTLSNATKFYFDDFSVAPIDVISPQISFLTVVANNQLDVHFNEAVDPTTAQTLFNYNVNNGIGNPSSATRDALNFSLVHLTFSNIFTDAVQDTLTIINVKDLNNNAIASIHSDFTYYAPVVAAYKDVIINEIFADPTPQVGLPSAEFIEIYNRSSKTFNLNGRKFTDGVSTGTMGTYTLSPSNYLILCNVADTNLFSSFNKPLGLAIFPSLNNSGDNLHLKDNNNTVIDSANYSDTWYQNANKKDGGWSLELINPNANNSCPVSSNWKASVNNAGGTPGSQNSIYSIASDTVSPTIAFLTIADSLHVKICFTETIDTSLLNNPNNYFISNAIGQTYSAVSSHTNNCVDLVLSTSLKNGNTYTLTLSNLSDCSANGLSPNGMAFNYVYAVPDYRDIIINEIFADPTPQIGLPSTEYVELFNRSLKTFNLNGWKFTDGVSIGTLNTYTLSPNQYLILCNKADTNLLSSFGKTMGLITFPSLNNGADNLYIKDNNNGIIDSVNYSDSWYQDANKKDGGWSLELINPDVNNNCPNWIASVNSLGGTPGNQNSVYSTAGDTTNPTIISWTIVDSMHINVCFTETIDTSLLNNRNNYFISNGIGQPDSVVVSYANNCVDLFLSSSFINGNTYTLTFSNLADCSGNGVSPNNVTFNYVHIVPDYRDIVINEIFADPSPQVGLPSAEYVELLNRSLKTYNLSGWQFSDGVSTGTLNTYTLSPNQHLILCNKVDSALFSSFNTPLGLTTFPSLNNAEDHLYIKDNNNMVIDSVNYYDSWYQDANKKDGGWSLELINPNVNNNCPISSNWIASVNFSGGTPGNQNSVYSTIGDTIKPKIIFVAIVDSAKITLCFSEAIDSTLLSDTSNYFINNGIGNPLSVIPNSDLTCVNITLSKNLISKNTYTIALSNLSDCSGNIISPSNMTFTYYVAKPYDVVINEIMADPDPPVSLPNYEYIELYNTTSYKIDLNGWTITAGTISKTLTNISILPDSFLVLTSITGANEFGSSIAITGLASFPLLTNSGQTLILKNASGTIISTISYTDQWYQDQDKKDGGWSLEQMDVNNPCAGSENWKASTNISGGTPGRKNSIAKPNPDNASPQLVRVSVADSVTIQVYFDEPLDSTTLLDKSIYNIDNGIGNPINIDPIEPDFKSIVLKLPIQLQKKTIYNISVGNTITDCKGNILGLPNFARFAIPEVSVPFGIVINEILFDPKDNGVDFVEIYNRSDKIIDLKTLSLSSYDTLLQVLTSVYIISDNGYLFFPQEYLVLTTDPVVVKDQYFTVNANGFLQMQTIPAMNISDGIIVIASGLTIIDKLAYKQDMHFPLLNSTKGVSLERIDFNRITQDATNWHSAAESVGFATPAYRNSQYLNSENGNEIKISPEVFSPDNDGYNDVVNISYGFDSPGFVANVTIYDSKGRLVKSLVKNELLATSGIFSWDGINDSKEKALIGIYVIYFEVFNLQGQVKHFKNTCVLASKL